MWMEQQEQVYLPSQHPQQQTLHPGIVGTDEAMHHHRHHHRSSAMDLPGPSNPRASRNMAEKQRRDNLNTNISAMAALVPTVAESPKKLDKISILRLAVSYIRLNYAVGRRKIVLPQNLNDLDLEQFFVDNVIGSGSFFLAVTMSGKIVYVSQQVQEYLGHTKDDLLGKSLYAYVHEQDRDTLKKNLIPDELQGIVTSSIPQITDGTNDNSNSSEDSASLRNERNPFRERRRYFELRLLHRTASRREHAQYECFGISGLLRLADACRDTESNVGRTRHRESTPNDIIFVGVAQLLLKRPITKLQIMDANKNEYVTRHLVDGRIIYCDHRVSVVTGYLSQEVSGLNAFSFMHKDDCRWALVALHEMFVHTETCGSSCYRLLSKTGQFIYLRTHGHLEVDKTTQTSSSFVCINTLVSEEEGLTLIEEMKKRYSSAVSDAARHMIKNGEDSSFDLGSDSQQSNSKSSVEDPSQLEDAITHLVSDLSTSVSDDRLSPTVIPNEQHVKAAMVSQYLPPAAAQASKIGIKQIDHYLVMQGNRGKQESSIPNDKHSDYEKQECSRSASGTSLTIQDVTNEPHEIHEIHEIHENSPNETDQIGSIITSDKSIGESCISVVCDPRASLLEISENIEDTIDVSKHQQEPISESLDNSVVDSATSGTKSNHSYPLKRIYSDENIRTNCNKKRPSNVLYVSTDTSDQQQNGSYVDCRQFINEGEFAEVATHFNQFDNIQYNNSQSLKITESPSSSLDDANPDLIMKIFDDFRHVPIFENTFNKGKVQTINNEISKNHIQLVNSMALQESQLNVLARDLENPNLQSQKGSLALLQAEHNVQKQILKKLSQHHHNIQNDMTHNIGV